MNMKKNSWKEALLPCDERRDLLVGHDKADALTISCDHFIETGKRAIAERGKFCVALAGGSTPKEIYTLLAKDPGYRTALEWSKVYLFWSDERYVPQSHSDSNYRMAMEAGLETLGIPASQIFPFDTAIDIEQSAIGYEKLLHRHTNGVLDLVMLGMGEDGHTASLFPRTAGLKDSMHLAIASDAPENSCSRLTLTFTAINSARTIALYVFGATKALMVAKALLGPYDPIEVPAQQVGLKTNKALWILDYPAAAPVIKFILEGI